MSEQSVHQQNQTNKEEIEQQNIYIYKKGEINYENIKICRQLCSDILRVGS